MRTQVLPCIAGALLLASSADAFHLSTAPAFRGVSINAPRATSSYLPQTMRPAFSPLPVKNTRMASLRMSSLNEAKEEAKEVTAIEKKSVGKRVMSHFAKAVLGMLTVAVFSAAASAATAVVASPVVGWWDSAKFWGGLGAIAGWGMTLAAINDGLTAGPDIISENMTFVMIVYSSLFAWWAWVVEPRNVLLCACHVSNVLAQSNQARRLINYKLSIGERALVQSMATKAVFVAVLAAVSILGGPIVQTAVATAGLGAVSTLAAAKAGPFTVHFWAPMSKWLISGASFLDLKRPTDKVSLPQYTALTLTGAFFSRYALLVQPINYVLCSVNIALFISSFWHLARKVKADFFSPKLPPPPPDTVAEA